MISATQSAAITAVLTSIPGTGLLGTFGGTAAAPSLESARPCPGRAQREAIARAQAARERELAPLRQQVATAIASAGWRRARPAVEGALGVPVPTRRRIPWARIGKRAAAAILGALGEPIVQTDLLDLLDEDSS